jgi:formate dehydrogenase iron-sulfur subunit
MKGILIDVSKCIGCGACREACRVKNNLPESNDTDLSARTYTVVKTTGEVNYRRMCMHCLDPTCASVCPVGAFRKTAAGPVTYAAERCMGCRYCMVACPFSVPRYEWDKPLPLVQKCNMCSDRVLAGGVTACSEACPTGATAFGERTELIREARARIVAEPVKYVNRVYGRDEVGGTSVLYLSTVPFEQLGLQTDLDQKPLPLLTFRVLSKIPHLVALGSVALGGVWWITNRRAEVARAENGNKRQNGQGGGR